MTERVADIIQSPHNPLIKRIRSLGNRKTRYAERAFVLEGMRAFSAAVGAEIEPEAVFLADDACSGSVRARRSLHPTCHLPATFRSGDGNRVATRHCRDLLDACIPIA